MGNNEKFICASIVDVCQRLDRKGFGANHDGNVTVKFADRLYATPTGVSKADVTLESIIVCDLDGKKISGHGNIFSEIKLHIAAYRARPEISAVVHAHPPYATARGLIGKPIENPGIPEFIVSIGDLVPVSRFAMPGDPENDSIVKEMLNISNVFMMPGNGVLSVGADLKQAYLRIELVEHVAKICQIASREGVCAGLSASNVNALLEKRAAAGLAPPSGSAASSLRGVERRSNPENIQKLIEDEIRKVLGNAK